MTQYQYKSKQQYLEDVVQSEDEIAAIKWAKRVLDYKEKYVILDTETTGLAEIVQLTIINLLGEPILNTLVKPTIAIPSGVIAIHGITNKMVAQTPCFPDIYPQLRDALFGKIVIIYNANFERGIINYCCKLHELDLIFIHSNCLMQRYAEYCGEWSNYHRSYCWQKLPGGDHTALGDCLASLDLLKKLANTPILSNEEIEINFEFWWAKRFEREQEYQDELDRIGRDIEAGLGPF